MKIQLFVLWLLGLLAVSNQKPMFREIHLESKEYEDCLLECMTCVELWGAMYDGYACANGCYYTNGSSIDTDCKYGVNIGKRVAEFEAVKKCQTQCQVCATEMSHLQYNNTKCRRECQETRGKSTDFHCKKHSSWYSFLQTIRHVQ